MVVDYGISILIYKLLLKGIDEDIFPFTFNESFLIGFKCIVLLHLFFNNNRFIDKHSLFYHQRLILRAVIQVISIRSRHVKSGSA